jgi:PhzF family phenazine biosynthesis protein
VTARRFAQVDVFAEGPLAGNPLAVVLNSSGLVEADLLAFARWTNLSETTFVLPPSDARADYAVRIFTPDGELPFAGHPTLGTAHAWLGAGGVPNDPSMIVQECGVGLVDIRRDGELLAFRAPDLRRSGPLDVGTVDRIVAALRIDYSEVVDHRWADNGPHWACVRLRDAQRVLDLEPDLSLAPELEIGVVGLYPAGARHAYEVRAFAHTLPGGEDPVTGSLNAGIAQWLLGDGIVSGSWTAGQGSRRQRDGVVHLVAEPDGTVWVGGAVRTIVDGTVDLG